MTTKGKKKSRKGLASVTRQLAAIQEMSVGQLRELYREVFGVPTRSRNRDYIRKKVAYGIQEQAAGGLSEKAQAKIAELIPGSPVRHRPARKRAPKAAAPKPKSASRSQAASRDQRLPAVGTVITREHGDTEHLVTVLERSFEYDGEEYDSLSQVARAITGTNWNGYTFFHLQKPCPSGNGARG